MRRYRLVGLPLAALATSLAIAQSAAALTIRDAARFDVVVRDDAHPCVATLDAESASFRVGRVLGGVAVKLVSLGTLVLVAWLVARRSSQR